MEVTQVGLFVSQKPLDRKQLAVMQVLEKYYTPQVLKEVLIPIIAHKEKDNKEEKLSLRAIDWLVTNLSKKTPIIYKVKPPSLPERVVNIYNEYKTWLWKHRRSHFDQFRRRRRLSFELDGEQHTTTVG